MRGASTRQTASLSCARRLNWGSISSTQPTSTPAGPARRCWAASSSATPAARRSRRHQGSWRNARRAQRAGTFPARPSFTSSTRAFAGWAWTTWIFTRSTAGTTIRPSRRPWRRLHEVVKSGRVRYIGASSMYAWQFAKALYLADLHHWTRFVSMQNHYNLLYREEEREMMALCRSEGIGVIPWSPLARGRLDPPMEERNTKRSQDRPVSATACTRAPKRAIARSSNRLGQIAEHRGLPHAQIALPGCSASRSSPAPIVGATKPQHLRGCRCRSFRCASLQMTSPPWRKLYEPHRFSASAEAAATSDTGRYCRG